MENKLLQYNLSIDNNKFYIFEIKLKSSDNNKYTIRKIKKTMDGNLINSFDNINNIISLKMTVIDFNNPTNQIIIRKKDIDQINSTIIQNKNILLHINNNDNLIINYKILNK